MRSTLVLAAFVAGLALLATLAWRRADAGGGRIGRPPARPAAGRAPDGEGTSGTGAAAGERAPPVGEERRAPAAVGEPRLDPEPGDGVLVHVVRGRAGAPVPFAEVLVGAAPGLGALDRAAYGWTGALEPREPRRLRADADGRVRVPRSSCPALLTCADAGDFGKLSLGSVVAREEELVRLLPAGALEVEVMRGPEREPAPGVSVVVLRRDEDESAWSLVSRARTGPDGVARFPHARYRLDGAFTEATEYRAALSGVFEEAPYAAFRPEALPARVAMELPPATRLEVDVLEADGSPASGDVLVRLARAGEEQLANAGRVAAELAVGGRATFEQVGPDLALELFATRDPAAVGPPVAVRSAAEPGGAARATIRLAGHVAPRRAAVLARVLLEGAPLAARPVEVELGPAFDEDGAVPGPALGPGTRDPRLLRTRADGTVSIPIPAPLADVEALALRVAAAAPHEGRSARRVIAGPFAPEERAIGDVVLLPEPLVAAGRVVGPDGAPVEGAVIRIAQDPSEPRLYPSAPTDRLGAFEVRSTRALRPFEVVARHPAFAPGRAGPLVAGATGVEVRLGSATGGLRGSVACEPALAPYVDVRLRAHGRETWALRGQVEWPGTFELRGIEPGRYDVAFVLENDAGLVAEDGGGIAPIVHDVAVLPGEIREDPRLREVELGAAARRIVLEVTDARGTPIRGGLDVRYRGAGGEHWEGHGVQISHVVRLATRRPALDVRIRASGFDPLLLAAVNADRVVVLERERAARFHWERAPPPDDRVVRLAATLRIQETGGEPQEVDLDVAAEPGAGDLVPVPDGAVLSVVWLRLDHIENGRYRSTEHAAASLVLPPGRGPHEVALAPPPELLAAVEAAPAAVD